MSTGFIERHWYQRSWLSWILLPVALLFCLLVAVRRALYRLGVFSSHHVGAPVIVVGNISVGGTGKTPLVILLAGRLSAAGYNPGIVLRGYGGHAPRYPLEVDADSDPQEAGDEAVLLARRVRCPVIVDPGRVRGARALVAGHGCDVVISDDGLQHYALARDMEIAVVDGERRHGNGFCLPAGPLREPPARLREVDLVVVNGDPRAGEYRMRIRPLVFRALKKDGPDRPLDHFAGQTVHAIAGIGNPNRFFSLLRDLGMVVQAHAYPDHHRFRMDEISFADGQPIIMTEKDAVKCARLAEARGWYLAAEAKVEEAVFTFVEARLRERLAKPGIVHG